MRQRDRGTTTSGNYAIPSQQGHGQIFNVRLQQTRCYYFCFRSTLGTFAMVVFVIVSCKKRTSWERGPIFNATWRVQFVWYWMSYVENIPVPLHDLYKRYLSGIPFRVISIHTYYKMWYKYLEKAFLENILVFLHLLNVGNSYLYSTIVVQSWIEFASN